MKRTLITLMTVLLVVPLILALALPAAAQEPFPYVTDRSEYCQIKVAQVPIPWQFWAIDPVTGEVIDKIRISPTWLEPPEGQPRGEGPVLIQRQYAVVPGPPENVVPLEELVWDFVEDRPVPSTPIDWWEREDPTPIEVIAGEDVELEIKVTDSDVAVLVAYEVMLDTTGEVVGHFINEAILESSSPREIVQVMVNFDVHNDTEFNVTNFELDFLGLDFGPEDVLWALGFVAAQGIPPAPVPPEPWGANEDNPLVVRPIEGGTEVKWIQPDRPLKPCEWLHGGLSFTLGDLIDGVNATVQGYWTVIGCQESVNPHGKNIPPAGKTTLPGPKGGQNEDGFYQLLPSNPELEAYVGTVENPQLFSFPGGTVVKITEAPGATPSIKKMGSNKGQARAVAWHITLPSDPVVSVFDKAGNLWSTRCCLVPPPPK